jgi:hypothetical protein
MHVLDASLWQDILDGKINGYSYEAMVTFMPALLTTDDDGERVGTTEPDTNDGHVHEFYVMVDAANRPVMGGTDVVQGHSHTISVHTVTDTAFNDLDEHAHRYNLITGKYGK